MATATQPPASTVPADIEAMAKGDANFAKDLQVARQQALGLKSPEAEAFIEANEFISLGCYCGVSTAFQGIGIRGAAYPFDWLRSSLESLVHCFENDFDDFLTYTKCANVNGVQGYVSARWGGSFWHHNPEDAKTRGEFTRRIERLLGLGKVPASAPRVFVRAVNSTSEILGTLRLFRALQEALPESHVRLVLLIDIQDEKAFFQVTECGDDVLFFRVHKGLFDEPRGIHKCIDPYGEAISTAIRLWAGDESVQKPCVLSKLKKLNSLCQQFDGGAPASELFNPLPYQGERIKLSGRSAPSRSTEPEVQAPVVPKDAVQIVEIQVPAGAKTGDIVKTHAFGKDIRVEMPTNTYGGQMLQLRCVEGVVTFALAAAMTSTATEALAAGVLSASGSKGMLGISSAEA